MSGDTQGIEVFGRPVSRERLIESVGDMSQICSLDAFAYDDGMARGVRGLQFRNPSGLQFVVMPDRGMDIASVDFRGVPLNWRSGTGVVSADRSSAREWEWLRGFTGGMLVTCGLSNVGDPCTDRGAYQEREHFGGHGRISNVPAREVSHRAGWDGERYLLRAQGTLIEASAQGENFSLTRTVETEMGKTSIRVGDLVTNRSFYTVPHMFLYHINVGWPLLDEGARLHARIGAARGLDGTPERDLGRLTELGAPKADAPELVFVLDIVPDSGGFCHVAFVNRRLAGGLALTLRYRTAEMPYFNLWKRLGRGEYVVGLEPGNCTVQGRVAQRERGDLRTLAPQESASYGMEFGILEGNDRIDAFLEAHTR
jgi:hypothetical protein